MRASRDSSAYREYEERRAVKEKQVRKKKPVKQAKAKKRAVNSGLVASIAVIAVTAVFILYCQMRLTQLTAEINEKNAELEDLVAQNVSLSSKQAYEMDVGEIEEYASKKLGMVKMDSGQIEYIELTNPDELTVSNPGLTSGKIFKTLKDAFLGIVEYIR